MKLKKEKNYFNFPIFFLSVFVILFLLISNIKIEKKKSELLRQSNELKEKLQGLEERKKKIEEGILRAQTREFWEEKAREEGYVKEGEEVIVIKETIQKSEEEKKNEGFFEKIYQGFKKFLK